ncbi:hypothetical protein PFICI_02364 [Pestalotiopsis fici W106-1]|uniref:Xylanolytic transcriptional activator regulatory domain-containing protein n=1 Tax=Pestalotiopsis fici (strain W106-1 / CGMCC3.15140) TaxID=1229662 RepID=W3XE99_PESFW|nr:uncharacterized protein PFICI_02364 [Pestalotiopsis fici W106-1]ETS84339.1 hypothetical protein PFICI_02364 [Pestalotiopsis fici W106-1]
MHTTKGAEGIPAIKVSTPEYLLQNRAWHLLICRCSIDTNALLRRLALLEKRLDNQGAASVDTLQDHETLPDINFESPQLSPQESSPHQEPGHNTDEQVQVPKASSASPASLRRNVSPKQPYALKTARHKNSQMQAASHVLSKPELPTFGALDSSPRETQNPSPLPPTTSAPYPRKYRDYPNLVQGNCNLGTDSGKEGPFDLLSEADARSLFETYLTYVHPQYPFLCKTELDKFYSAWKAGRLGTELDDFQQCVFCMVLSIGALIFDGNTRQNPTRTEVLYAHVEKYYLPKLFSGKDLVRETVFLLLLTMHALHSSSSNAIIQHTSAATRTAITAGLHRKSSRKDRSLHEHSQSEQMRRRIWWCCYGLDRGVAIAFGHPVSIPDEFITVQMFSVNPRLTPEAITPPESQDFATQCEKSEVCVAHHLTYGRKIQSRIISTCSSPSLGPSTSQLALDRMRSQFCQELEEWQASIPMPTDKPGYGGRNWFRMVAYYSIVGLASGSNDEVRHAVGAKAIIACCNACITFQQIQRSRQIAHSWLAVLSQFQAGITILYCFWTTPPHMRSDEFEPSYASRGVRTCSNNLVLLAERWREAEPYRDAFEIVSKLVPLTNDLSASIYKWPLPRDLEDLGKLVEQVRYLGAHYRTIDMIEEILRQKRPVWAVGNRRTAHQPLINSTVAGSQPSPPAHRQEDFGGRFHEGLEPGTWYNEQMDFGQEYFGLGDPWVNPDN